MRRAGLMRRILVDLNKRLAKNDFRIVLGPRLEKELRVKSAISQFGGRALRRSFQSLVVDPVSDRLLGDQALCRGVWVLETDDKGDFHWQEDASTDHNLPAVT